MVWMHYSIGRFLMCGENTREWYGRMLYFVDYFFGFFKKEAKKWQLCQFSVFYQRKFNGIKRFCGANQKKIWQVLQHSCSCEHRSGCCIAFHCEKPKGKPEKVLQPCHSFPPGELQSWAWCVESLWTCQPHCMLLWNMSQYFVPEGNKSSLLGIILLMLVGAC